MDKACAVIVAAGKGKRMGTGKNKQFIDIKGKPVLCRTLEAFSRCPAVDEIVLVCAGDEIGYCRDEIVGKYGFEKVKSIVSGGTERQDSVYSGLSAVKGRGIVLIHDGARPFVTNKIINDGIRFAEEYGASACGVTPKDTIKVKGESGFSECTLDRSRLFSVQTPQCFKIDLILGCYEKLMDEEIIFTDDTSVAEHFGHKVYLYEGSYENIKITTPEDLAVAESILSKLEK
ncbi:MAG: 2-C-methyl-D-erythritol 4-phosphate cytidylyltransferase [Firmicutes bacterium]|nr:2-C-methyl-D-erythritol 4-phosphate cytidylyltransferase [Bacillota bacterium]